MIYFGCTAAILTGLMDRQWIFNAYQSTANTSYSSETLLLDFTGVSVLASVWLVLVHHFPNPLKQKDDHKQHDGYEHLNAEPIDYRHLA
jgi:hypothetical protein